METPTFQRHCTAHSQCWAPEPFCGFSTVFWQRFLGPIAGHFHTSSALSYALLPLLYGVTVISFLFLGEALNLEQFIFGVLSVECGSPRTSSIGNNKQAPLALLPATYVVPSLMLRLLYAPV